MSPETKPDERPWPDYKCTCIALDCERAGAHKPRECTGRGAHNAGSVCRACVLMIAPHA